MDDTVLLARDGPVAVLTINRAHRSNAIDTATAELIAALVAEVEADPAIRAAVLTGTGSTVFCAGADLKAKAAGGAPAVVPGAGFAGFVRLDRTKPFVAAVNGAALGGGFELALACDLVVASCDAYFSLPEVSRGLVAAGGGVVRLPQRIPYAIAAEIVLTGRRVTAEEAFDLGLVNRVVAPSAVLASAVDLARQCAQGAPLAVQESLGVMREAGSCGEQLWQRSDAAARRVGASEDGREGPRAFADKRTPRWTGH